MPPQISAPHGGQDRGAARGTDVRHDLWAPTLVRAAVALVFAAVTVFWQEPSLEAGRWVMAFFLVGTGASAIFLQVRLNRREDVDLGASRSIPQSYGVLYVLGGVLTAVVAQSNWLFVLLSSVILVLCGITELVLGMRFRGQFPLGRDWTLCGAITVFAAMGMVLVETLGAKAELGVVGGAAILIGVTQLIAALSLRHDARVADGPASGPAREA
ncbi:uncharacterized membrane protein HdeD (DUF308 family) [Kocuria rhizophila]|uniref:hypothetical protein n=1 Tax=Kocuria TaxID=57493 RepID=UPI000F6DFB7E|nr:MULTISPECIES: hypothetical protein [Kocuria]MDA4827696.1 hypothetical protein [Kocuria rhizophila]WSQ04063.1 hypothetical protein OG312_06490 [Kocuria rhizophila]VEH76258.1 Uncharacterized conserved protein [Kocuria rhizophila]